MEMEVELGVMHLGAQGSKGAPSPQKLEEAWSWCEQTLPTTLLPCPHLDFSTAGLQHCVGICFCCWQPPTFWLFTVAAPGHSHK